MYIEFPFLHILTKMLFVFFSMTVILTGMRHIIVILICIFLMISDHVEQLLCQTGIFFFKIIKQLRVFSFLRKFYKESIIIYS